MAPRRTPRAGGKSEATPARGRISAGDGFVLIRPDGSIWTSSNGNGFADASTLERVKAGTDVQTTKGLLTYQA